MGECPQHINTKILSDTKTLKTGLQHAVIISVAAEDNVEVDISAGWILWILWDCGCTLELETKVKRRFAKISLVGAFNQEKALVGALSVITNLCVDLRFKL